MIRSATVRTAVASIALAAVLVVGGCKMDPASTSGPLPDPAPAAHVNAGPKETVDTVKRVLTNPPLSLSIASDDGGTIVTGFQRFPGEVHVVRRWQEQTRYRIVVTPDWNDPQNKSRLEVTEQTQQRATDGQPWQSAPELTRPKRAADLLHKIQEQLPQSTTMPGWH